MTPEHTYIAIGAALFASLLVAWLWGRRRRGLPKIGSAWLFVARADNRKGFAYLIEDVSDKHVYFASYVDGESPTDCRYTHEVWRRERDKHYAVEFVTRDAWVQWLAKWKATLHVPGANTITVGPEFGKPAPYSPRIAGTGSRPEAPWASKEDYADLKDMVLRLRERVLVVENENYAARARLARLEAGVPTVAGLTEDQWNTPPRVVPREAGGEGDGVRVFIKRRWTWLYDGDTLYFCGLSGWWGARYGMAPAELERWHPGTEIPPTDPRYAEVVESWRNRESS